MTILGIKKTTPYIFGFTASLKEQCFAIKPKRSFVVMLLLTTRIKMRKMLAQRTSGVCSRPCYDVSGQNFCWSLSVYSFHQDSPFSIIVFIVSSSQLCRPRMFDTWHIHHEMIIMINQVAKMNRSKSHLY